MTQEEYKKCVEILWDNDWGHKITTSPEVSDLLRADLESVGVKVLKVAKKYRSPNKFLLFTVQAYRVEGMETMFFSREDAESWHQAKNKSLRTLAKAPDEAFLPVKCGEVEELLWWAQAFNVAYRLGSNMSCKEKILSLKGAVTGKKFGL